MDLRQKVSAAIFGIGLLLIILELVRRRKLKEEYSWLWIIAGVVVVCVGLNYSLLQWLTGLIGAGLTSSALFFFGIFFVLALCLQFSVKVSSLENKVKNLTQEVALLRAKKADEQDTAAGEDEA